MFQSNNASTQQKSQMIPNSSMVPQSIVNTQFKPQLAAMMNPPMCQLASLPHALAWTPTQPALMAAPNQPIILRASQPDGQHVFFQTSNQPIYVNQNNGAMHVMSASAHQNLSELHPPMISSAVVSSAPSSVISAVHTSKTSFSSSAQTATNNPTVNLNSSNHRARNQLSSSSIAVQQQPSTPDNPKSMNNRSKIGGLNNHSTSPGSNRSSSVGSHQSSRDVFQIGHNPSSAATQQKALAQQKSTQQMNAELLLKAGNTSTKIKQLGRSDSTRSLNSQGSEESKFYKNGESSKKSKDDSKHLNGKKLDRREISTENIEMNTSSKSQSNGTLKKSEKKKLGLGKSSQKTQVLTHCIDGHIILESSVPFPVLPNLSNTLRDRSNGIANQMNESNSLAAPDLINSKPNASGAVHSNAMQISTTSASATSKEVRIKNKKLKKSKLKAANQAALLARANGHIDEKNGSITTMPAPGTIVSIPGTLIPFETNMPQTITISKAATLASGLAQLTPQLADQTIAVCNGPNLTGHSTSLINGILVNDSVMELDESSFMQKQKIASTPIKEPSLNHQVPLNNPTSTGSTSAMPSLSNDKPVHWWSVQEVHDYVAEESGNECAKVLLDNHIDGRALLALTVPIMKDELKLKLGPVLVLKAKIDELGQKFKDHDKNPDYLPAEPNIYKWTVSEFLFYFFISCFHFTPL